MWSLATDVADSLLLTLEDTLFALSPVDDLELGAASPRPSANVPAAPSELLQQLCESACVSLLFDCSFLFSVLGLAFPPSQQHDRIASGSVASPSPFTYPAREIREREQSLMSRWRSVLDVVLSRVDSVEWLCMEPHIWDQIFVVQNQVHVAHTTKLKYVMFRCRCYWARWCS